MQKSTLYQLIRSFAPVEVREIRKFLHAPFFNQRQDVIDLFDYMLTMAGADKAMVWRQLFGNAPLEDQKLRLLMSYLHRLLEQYLTVRELMDDDRTSRLFLAKAYRKRQLPDAFSRVQKDLLKSLESGSLRNAQYHEFTYDLAWENHQLTFANKPTDAAQLRALSDAADGVYLTQKLRLICLLAAHQSVYQSEGTIDREAEIIALADRPEWKNQPAIAVYRHCYQMLRHPVEEAHFQNFKALLLGQSACFSAEEMYGLSILAINYCVRRLNAGEETYFREALDLYKKGLEEAYLFENGVLSRFTYHNIVAAGLHTRELDWVRYFINTYKNRLEKQYRESSFSFNLARLEYAKRNFDSVLELLQHANYRDPLLNLAAKTLLLKTYYETEEHDLLDSHLTAMRNYIQRKDVLGYHRTNYLNIIRYTEKLLKINFLDKMGVSQLREAIDREDVLTEKAFFRKVLE